MEKLSNARANIQQIAWCAMRQERPQPALPQQIARPLLAEPRIILPCLRIKPRDLSRRWPGTVKDVAAGIAAAEVEFRVHLLDVIALAHVTGRDNLYAALLHHCWLGC